jgi:adenylyltransferase/sulfurtransferase
VHRYEPQVKLIEIQSDGQNLIKNAKVLIVGAGGLGTIVATYLAAMGVGKMGIIDFDTVQITNLHRQFQYNHYEIDQYKAAVLSAKLKSQNPDVEIVPIVEKLDQNNFLSHIDDYSIVCDCSDNLHTRLFLDAQCFSSKRVLVHGAVSNWEGYVTLFHYKNQFQYRDLFDIKTLLQSDSCFENGISSPVCGIIGSVMANETIKIVLQRNSNLDGGLLFINGLENIFKILKLKKPPQPSLYSK